MSFIKRWKISAAGMAAGALMFMGCIHSGDMMSTPRQQTHMQLKLGVTRVGVLAKTSTITLNKLIVTITSSANDRINDTITATTSPSLNQLVSQSQTLTINFDITTGSTWKVVAKTLDTRDSVIHLDSATGSTLDMGGSQLVTLNLVPKYTMFQAQILNIPDSLSLSTSGSPKQVLHVTRFVLLIDGVVKVDSTHLLYFPAGSTVILNFDYMTTGTHTIQLQAYGTTGTSSLPILLFSGAVGVSADPGVDTNTLLTLNWTGPVTVQGGLQVIIGRIGQATVSGTFSSALTP